MLFRSFIYNDKELFNGVVRRSKGASSLSCLKTGLAAVVIKTLVCTPAVMGVYTWKATSLMTVNSDTQNQSVPGIFSNLNPIIAGTRALTQSGSVAFNPLPFTSVL